MILKKDKEMKNIRQKVEKIIKGDNKYLFNKDK